MRAPVLLVDMGYWLPLVGRQFQESCPSSSQGPHGPSGWETQAQRLFLLPCSLFQLSAEAPMAHWNPKAWHSRPPATACSLCSPCCMDPGDGVWHWIQGTMESGRQGMVDGSVALPDLLHGLSPSLTQPPPCPHTICSAVLFLTASANSLFLPLNLLDCWA